MAMPCRQRAGAIEKPHGLDEISVMIATDWSAHRCGGDVELTSTREVQAHVSAESLTSANCSET
jgi:hypothetical protein